MGCAHACRKSARSPAVVRAQDDDVEAAVAQEPGGRRTGRHECREARIHEPLRHRAAHGEVRVDDEDGGSATGVATGMDSMLPTRRNRA